MNVKKKKIKTFFSSLTDNSVQYLLYTIILSKSTKYLEHCINFKPNISSIFPQLIRFPKINIVIGKRPTIINTKYKISHQRSILFLLQTALVRKTAKYKKKHIS